MDKTIEVIVVAMVALVTGIAILYLATGQAEGFDGWAEDRQQGVQCDYIRGEYESTCRKEDSKLSSLESDAQDLDGCSLADVEPESCGGSESSQDSSPENPSESGPTAG